MGWYGDFGGPFNPPHSGPFQNLQSGSLDPAREVEATVRIWGDAVILGVLATHLILVPSNSSNLAL